MALIALVDLYVEHAFGGIATRTITRKSGCRDEEVAFFGRSARDHPAADSYFFAVGVSGAF